MTSPTAQRSLVLGIESSCDETAAAFVEGGERIVASVIASQTEIHAPYGGVVPELASRAHIERIMPLLEDARAQAGGVEWDEIEGIAVTAGPGLVGCLLVGIEAAKGLALARNKPIAAVQHLAGHLWSVFLRDAKGRRLASCFRNGAETDPEEFQTPYVGLTVSGGHTTLALVRGPLEIEALGHTLDDAAGEAYDKVAKLLSLGYPGGPVIDRLACEWEEAEAQINADARASRESDAGAKSLTLYQEWPLPRPLAGSRALEVSFSGLKTAVARLVEDRGGPESIANDPKALRSLCAAFQRRVVEHLLDRAELALEKCELNRLAVVGGVACNRGLRRALREKFAKNGVLAALPPPILCTDNAAMVAAVGAHRLRAGLAAGLDLNPNASMPF